ncbi:hypothetical protein EPUS_03849 [Endocarpon pusillum Z07020]|uniref:Uncharacterized protein n=1 Tax=Endocarpon pusillum (strain Z07020 / HMAS-L-300199) TaxID=1263415 RepID=U1HX80_ENDPU|nr:uncharacterized protein EPUS_03849 [Endocarpon pusillum Z07020]ERF74034.1 hypothetical protein EPUS_03849 [Endocarpon pusillum Z07020]
MAESRPAPGVQRQSPAASADPRSNLTRNISAASLDAAVVPDLANPLLRVPSQAQRDRQAVREAHSSPRRGGDAHSGNSGPRPGEQSGPQASGGARSQSGRGAQPQSGEVTASQRAKDPYRHSLLVDRLKSKGHIAQGKQLLSRADSLVRKEPKTASDMDMANELRKRGDYLCKEGTDSALRLEQEFLSSYSPTMKDFYTPAQVTYCTAIRDVLRGEADAEKRLERFRARLRTLSSGSTVESDANLRCEYVQVIDQELRLIAGTPQKPTTGNSARRTNPGSVVEDAAAGVNGPSQGAGRATAVNQSGSPSKKRDAPDTSERPATDAIRRNTSQGLPPGRPNDDASRMNTTLGIPVGAATRLTAHARGAGVSGAGAGPAGSTGPDPFANHPGSRPSNSGRPIASHSLEPRPADAHPAGTHATGSGPPGTGSIPGHAAPPTGSGNSGSERECRAGTTGAGPSESSRSDSSTGATGPARLSHSGGSFGTPGSAPGSVRFSNSDSDSIVAATGSPRGMDQSSSHGGGSGRHQKAHHPMQKAYAV